VEALARRDPEVEEMAAGKIIQIGGPDSECAMCPYENFTNAKNSSYISSNDDESA